MWDGWVLFGREVIVYDCWVVYKGYFFLRIWLVNWRYVVDIVGDRVNRVYRWREVFCDEREGKVRVFGCDIGRVDYVISWECRYSVLVIWGYWRMFLIGNWEVVEVWSFIWSCGSWSNSYWRDIDRLVGSCWNWCFVFCLMLLWCRDRCGVGFRMSWWFFGFMRYWWGFGYRKWKFMKFVLIGDINILCELCFVVWVFIVYFKVLWVIGMLMVIFYIVFSVSEVVVCSFFSWCMFFLFLNSCWIFDR